MEQDRTVLVVGAGVAGLAAAGVLAAAGFDVNVVEARDRVGGRIHTLRPEDAGGPVELGAEFVHGRPPELLRLFEEAGIALEEAKGVDRCFEDGRLTECTEDDSSNLLDELPGVVEREGDMSFDAFLQSHYPGTEMAESVRGYVEGFNAADAQRIGIAALARQQQAEEAIEGDRILRPVGGYDALARHLAAKATQAGARILLHTRIASIVWERGRVVARSEPGQQFAAGRAVITLPLGVLQSGGVGFEPVPAGLLAAAGSMEAGAVLRLVLIFRSAFWRQRMPDMRFLFSRDLTPATWWTQYPRDTPVLVGWLGGPRAAEAEALDRAQFLDRALRSLERAFDLRTHALDAELHSWHLHDWLKDPLTRGAYSYAPAGALESSAAMAHPVEGTLYFAGEHTDLTGHWGTVHGAIGSGMRAAQQVLADQP